MGLLFKDDLHEEFGTSPLGYSPWGGVDFGEVRAVGQAVGDGDDGAFYAACAVTCRQQARSRSTAAPS